MSEDRARASCAAVSERIEAYLDAELDAASAERLESHAATCVSCRRELEHARLVLGELRGLPLVECPPRVSEAVLAQVRERAAAQSGASVAPPAAGLPSWWALAAAALIALAAGIAALTLPFADRRVEAPERSAVYTQAELEQAEQDLRFALAYFGGIARKAGMTLRDDVIADRVLEPPRRAMARWASDRPAGAGTDEIVSEETL